MKAKKKLTPEDRQKLITDTLAKMMNGNATTGTLLTVLRKDFLGMRQDKYAKLVGVSVRTLSNIENDNGDQTISSVNKAFRPFGITVGLWPKDTELVKRLEEYLESGEEVSR
jgi:DNA-binding XRE family transcriptional regulator